jgi:ribonucleoside-diphosphate reductase alpha chain
MPKEIRKRDGRVVPFDAAKIRVAIEKALTSVGRDTAPAANLTSATLQLLEKQIGAEAPTVEQVQDAVEKTLIANGQPEAAKHYILYRRERSDIRAAKRLLGVSDDLKLSLNAVRVLERRYLIKDERGSVVETPGAMFRRVAHAVAQPDTNYTTDLRGHETEEEFYDAMTRLEFLPNSPTLMNAGTPMGQLSACFVLPVEDSIEGIFRAVGEMALIHQSGGGTGFSFSRLRPRGDIVRSTHGVASGPVSFIRVFDVGTDVIKQGGRRRGANMGILHVSHPDIMEFIHSKVSGERLKNFNISVAVDDEFMKAVESGGNYDLINPRNGEVASTVKAADIFSAIVTSAWQCADPGMIFLDEINRRNQTPFVGAIEATNPCGEQPLFPYESCNLGSVNLAVMLRDGKIDYEKLARAVNTAVHFLDNVIDASKFPLDEVRKATHANRKIGLGVMGWAEMLIQMGVPYDSEDALRIGGEVMKFISETARKASAGLAEKRGEFPNFPKSIWAAGPKLRNATVTSVAPTGTISLIAGTSSGIEPVFSLAYSRNVLEGAHLRERNRLFEDVAHSRGFFGGDLMLEVARKGSARNVAGVPEDVKRLFVTALDIAPAWHVKMQAAFQQFTDNGVSKTCNLPQNATQADVREIYLLAHKLRCKGITVFRYGSKPEQVLTIESGAACLECD